MFLQALAEKIVIGLRRLSLVATILTAAFLDAAHQGHISVRRILAYIAPILALAALAFFGVRADKSAFIASLFAAAISVLTVVFVEAELKPDIQIFKEPHAAFQGDGSKFLRVIVKNPPLWRPLRLFMDRRPAYQTRAWITFLTDNNDLVFSPGRRMTGRWANTLEPTRPIVATATSGQPGIVFMWDLSVTRDAVDIPSGGQETLDIVMRRPDGSGCRGWHNRMIGLDYEKQVPADQKFDLDKGRYRALVQIDSSGRTYTALFRIVCDTALEDFRLEPLTASVPKALSRRFSS